MFLEVMCQIYGDIRVRDITCMACRKSQVVLSRRVLQDSQGAPTSALEYERKIKLPLSRVFCGGLCEFLIRARGKLRGLLVGGLEPRSRKSGTRKFLGGSDCSPKIIK